MSASKRKLPDIAAAAVQVEADLQQAMSVARAQEDKASLAETPPRRIQKGSPADEFLSITAPQHVNDDVLTCDYTQVPKDRYSRRRKLTAIIIAVEPVIAKLTSLRRHVILRDEHGECDVCVWGNHTHILNEASIGRAVTFNRICLKEYEGDVQIHMPKDASVIFGTTSETVPVVSWFKQAGCTAITVPVALELLSSSIICISGMLGKIVSEQVTTKDGTMREVTTLYIAHGPPRIVVAIEMFDVDPDKIATYQVCFDSLQCEYCCVCLMLCSGNAATECANHQGSL